MYHATGDDRPLSLLETPTPFMCGDFHDFTWSADWAPVVIPDYHRNTMVMGFWVPIPGGRTGISEKVWGAIQNLSPKGAYALSKTGVYFSGSIQTYE